MTAAHALAERDRVIDEVITKMQARGTYTPAMQVFERWARTGREFGLNDIRGELVDVGVDVSKGMGGITVGALRSGLIRKVRDEVSTSPTTNGKRIGVYIGSGRIGGLSSLIPTATEHLTVPVRRAPTGRFTTPDDSGTPSLFDITTEGVDR